MFSDSLIPIIRKFTFKAYKTRKKRIKCLVLGPNIRKTFRLSSPYTTDTYFIRVPTNKYLYTKSLL